MSGQGRIAVAGVALVAAVAAFWFLVLAPKRADIAKVHAAVAQAEARRTTAENAVAASQHTRDAYQRDYARLARLGKATPADDDVASLLYQLEALAHANKVDFRAVKLSGGGAAPPAVPAQTSPSSSTSSTSSSDSTAKSAAAKDSTASDPTVSQPTTPVAPAITQAPPGAVVGSAGLLTLPFTFTFNGGYLPMQRMLGAIDRLAERSGGAISVRGRLLTVDGFSLTAGPEGFPNLSATVSATAYIVPAAEGVMGGATPQGPAASSVSQPGSSAGATPPATASATIQGVG